MSREWIAPRALWLVGLWLAVLGGCSETTSEKEPLVVTIPTLPPGTTTLHMAEAPAEGYYYYQLKVVSNARVGATLKVRLEADAPEGMSVRLQRNEKVLAQMSGQPLLIIDPPPKLGPYEARVTLYADELEDWSRTWEVTGVVVRKQRQGRILTPVPAGVSLGDVGPAARLPFDVVLRNDGTEDLAVSRFEVLDDVEVELTDSSAGATIVAGGEYQMRGVVVAPKDAGVFSARVRVHSNAKNSERRDIVVSGRVLLDHELIPARLRLRLVYAPDGPEAVVKVRARDGVAPFRVREIKGLHPYFDVVSLGEETPAAAQTVRLRVRREAPVGVAEFDARFILDPGGIEVAWPVLMTLVPSVVAEPARLRFGRAAPGAQPRQEIRLSTFARRVLVVKSARSQKGYFTTELAGGRGIPWSVSVRPVDGLRVGQYRDTIEITTDDPDTPGVRVPVFIEIQAP